MNVVTSDMDPAPPTRTAAPVGSAGTAQGTARQAFDQVLRVMAGPDAVARPGQLEAVEALVERRERVLVVQATGWGKSMVYWTATVAMRRQGAGPTVVISPLLALMRDQIQAAQAAGLRAATVNSANVDDWNGVFEALRADSIDVLLVSPERLANPRFADRALPLLARAGLLVIDEAHCISDWGFDFRPDYQRVTRLLLHLRHGTPVLATTATANRRVTADVAVQLGEGTTVLRGPLARTSLQLSVVPGLSAIERHAWVGDALASLPGSGIVYCLTKQDVESMTTFLAEQGHNVAAYTGDTDPDERHRIEGALRANQVKAVVATSALGMGYDKPDLAFCIHVGSPSSPVAYYQQVGRAGRQLEHAHGILLPAGKNDEDLWHYFATATLPDANLAQQTLRALGVEALSVIDLEHITGARRGRLETLLKQLRVDGAVERLDGKWTSTGKGWTYDAAKYEQVLRTRRAEADLMRQYATGSRCLMQVLIEALDDPAAQPCGRCSVCTGELPPPGMTPQPESVQAAARLLRRRRIELLPRKQWPKGVSRRGRITACSLGRAIAFADDPGWPELVAEGGSPDAEPSAELMAMVADFIREWLPPRPDAIVALPTPGQRRRTAAVARVLGEQFGIEVADALRWQGDQVPAGLPSSRHVQHLEDGLGLTGGVPAGRILLVAATARSLWSVTVAAALLREAGATDVVPLVLHRQP